MRMRVCVRLHGNGGKDRASANIHKDNNDKGHGKVVSYSRKSSEIDNRMEFSWKRKKCRRTYEPKHTKNIYICMWLSRSTD